MTTVTATRKRKAAPKSGQHPERLDNWQLAAICERANRAINARVDTRHELRESCIGYHSACAEWHRARAVIEARKPVELALGADELGSSAWHRGRAVVHDEAAQMAREEGGV
ncbi:hypothetical protein SAMN05661010_02543 [Modicisalibacter muralis]|uniref:Uncharacterized protein n=1 Tax=Modicisalibacter muralis TaxID=119000 RepID=A0A1G9MWA0_9GAMM|nr:hypothetical protein [Halomonas muralis]SDL78404.1 hypothetical protein SAMN05661010_02543 [Halomonas muralis]